MKWWKKLLASSLVLAALGCNGNDDPVVPPPDPPEKPPVNEKGPLWACGSQLCLPSGEPIWLGGSHTGWEVQDGEAWEPVPRPYAWGHFLAQLHSWNHNLMRFWVVEHTSWDTDHPRFSSPAYPMQWARTGPGLANDGHPKFDLTKPNPDYYSRLRSRVAEADQRGMYTIVMLFQGVSLWTEMGNQGIPLEHWKSLVWNPENNIHGWSLAEPGWDAHRLTEGPIWEAQKSYIREVVKSLSGLPSVLIEVGNEDRHGSIHWQRAVVAYTRQAMDEELPHKPWPVGVTFRQGDAASNEELCGSDVDWYSPKVARGTLSPPPCPGKASLLDDDHFHIFATRTDYPSRARELGHAGYLHLHPAGEWFGRETERARRMAREHRPMGEAIGSVVGQ